MTPGGKTGHFGPPIVACGVAKGTEAVQPLESTGLPDSNPQMLYLFAV